MSVTHNAIPLDRYAGTRASVLTYGAALLLVAAATLGGLLIAARWGPGPVVLLYLPPVIVMAVYGGMWSALLAGAAATLAYNYFFTVPYRTLAIDSPEDVITVGMLFLVGLVTSHLAGSLRDQARLAADHAQRNATIAGLAGRLLSCTSEGDIAQVTATELARLFECKVVVLSANADPHILASEPTGALLAPSDLAAAALTLTTGEPSGRGVRRVDLADWQFRPIASGQRVIACVGLARDDGVPPIIEGQVALAGSLLDQVALALERARLEREAREVTWLRQRDTLRTALLATIGQDVKPRLNAIGAAARALKRAGAGDKTVMATIVGEATKLDRYIDNLVDLAPAEESAPLRSEGVTIDLHRRQVQGPDGPVHLTPKEYAVLAELAKHAGRVLTHAQLLRTVWGPAQQDHIDYLRVAISSLRQKLELDPAHPRLIVNEPAIGYRLMVEPAAQTSAVG